MSYIIQCDRCAKTGGEGREGHLPQEWVSVGMDIHVTGGTYKKWHNFCPVCTEYLRLGSDPTEETSAERLVAILESMIDEAVEERG